MKMEKKKKSPWNLQTRIWNLLHKESTSDVEFLVGTPSQRFLCHRAILAAGSAVFETMFFGTIKQNYPVRIPDVTAKGFTIMLQYLYSDKASIQDESDAYQAAYAAKKYMIKSLFSICETFLLKRLELSPENVFPTHEQASFLEMDNLQNCCLRYVSRNAKKMFQSDSFFGASKGTFEDILSLDLMNIGSEVEVIEALWSWGKQQCKVNGVAPSAENVRNSTKNFLKYVRFFTLTADEIVNVLGKCQILDTSEELSLLWSVAMPRTASPKVPQDMCTDSRTRSITSGTKIQFPSMYKYDGSLTVFLIENQQRILEITVTGPPVTVIGFVIAYKPIACYSRQDRSLEIEISASNCTSTAQTRAKSLFKAEVSNDKDEEQQILLLDDYMVIEELQTVNFIVSVVGEGVRLMQCTEEVFCYNMGKSEVCLKFDNIEEGSRLFPVKELMVA